MIKSDTDKLAWATVYATIFASLVAADSKATMVGLRETSSREATWALNRLNDPTYDFE